MKYFRYLLNYILSFLYDIYYFLFGNIRSRVFGFEYYKKSKLYPDYLKQGNMAEAVKWAALKYCQGRGVDVGGGSWTLPGARLVENNAEENAYKLKEEDGSLDFVFSSHSLEHLEKWQEALQEWRRALKAGGVMFFYLPHPVCFMWIKTVNKQHKWTPDPLLVINFLEKNLNMRVESASYEPDGFLSFMIAAIK